MDFQDTFVFTASAFAANIVHGISRAQHNRFMVKPVHHTYCKMQTSAIQFIWACNRSTERLLGFNEKQTMTLTWKQYARKYINIQMICNIFIWESYATNMQQMCKGPRARAEVQNIGAGTGPGPRAAPILGLGPGPGALQAFVAYCGHIKYDSHICGTWCWSWSIHIWVFLCHSVPDRFTMVMHELSDNSWHVVISFFAHTSSRPHGLSWKVGAIEQ